MIELSDGVGCPFGICGRKFEVSLDIRCVICFSSTPSTVHQVHLWSKQRVVFNSCRLFLQASKRGERVRIMDVCKKAVITLAHGV